jgi:hypothetical protein
MLQLTMMYLQSFLIFAGLIILFYFFLSAAASAEARLRLSGTSYMFFASFAENHFLTVGLMSDICKGS